MRVLLLEDDNHLRYMFSAALSQHGFDVVACAGIPETETALLNKRPDVAVLDLMIGHKTSLSIADLTTVLSPETEIIFVTGSGKFPHAELFHLQPSVAAVLRKPVDIAHLVELVSHIARLPKMGAGQGDRQSRSRRALPIA